MKPHIYILMSLCLMTAVMLSSCKKDEEKQEPKPEIEIKVPEGALPYLFSVSPTKKVFFAKGNLQYRASTDIWRFAENQWDYVGIANMNRSATYDEWIDLFGYGSSGYEGKEPWLFYNNDYYNYEEIPKVDISGTNYDWGIYNPISNAGNKSGLWRSLTYDEIHYMMYERSFIGFSFGLGNLIFPDSTKIAGVFIFSDNSKMKNEESYMLNKISMTVAELEQTGTVFLPPVGSTWYGSFEHYSDYYWGSIRNTSPYLTEFNDHYLWAFFNGRELGGVRLVCDYDESNN